jgi:hypothetical protein
MKKDLGNIGRLSLDWSPAGATESLEKIFAYVMTAAEETIDWYVRAKNIKRHFARGIRVLAILLGAAAALLPTIIELFSADNKQHMSAGWTVVLIGSAGTLLLLDRFFGFSAGWMRYIATELQLRQITQEFQMDWEAEKVTWQGSAPSVAQITQMVARCKAMITQINTLVRDETNAWIKEFESTISQIDESVKLRTAIAEPGALNLTVTNGDATQQGWTIAIDNGEPDTHSGKTVGKRNLIPGRHEIRIEGKISDKVVRAEKVVNIPAGGTCNEMITLE